MEVDSDNIENYIEISDSDEDESDSKPGSKTKMEMENYCRSIMTQEVCL